MKVLFIDQIATVNYKYSFSICNELKKQDVKVDLVMDNKMDNSECLVNTYSFFRCAEKGMNKLKKIVNYFKSIIQMYYLIRENNYDIIHAQWFILSPLDYYFLKIAKKKNIKIVVTIHDILPFNQQFYDLYYHKKIYALADNIIIQAQDNIKRFEKLFPSESSKVSLIPHGTFANYTNVIDKKIAREFLNIPQDKKVLLFFGQIKKVKGLSVLIDAFYEVRKNRSDILLVIAGSVWKDDFSIYQQQIDKLNLLEDIYLSIKYIPDEEIDYYYSAADINILPYLDVYQSGVVQLAFGYEKAVIATRVGGFKDIIKDGFNGVLVEPNDYKDLAMKINELIDDKEKMKIMGKEGKKFVLEHYSWDSIGKKIFNIYQM